MAGIEDAFEKFSDRLAREESKRYSRDEQGEYKEYLSEEQDPYPIKLGPLQLGANANMVTGKYSPNEYQNVSTMNRNVGLRGRYDVPDSGIALLGSIGDVRSNQNVKTNLPFNPMTGEASPYSEMTKDVYKDSPYSVGAQYTPKGTEEMYSALYNKGGGYNLGYNKGPVNISYTSNPGLGNNVMLRGQYSFADGGRAGYAGGGKPTREDSPILQINPMEKDIQFSQDPTMEQMPNVGIAAIGLTKKAKDYNRYIKAFESNDPKVFKKWFDSQTKEFSKTKKLAEDAEMFELIPEVARGASKTEKQLANNQLRESMGGYYAQELGPYYSQEIGILDNLIFKAYGGRVSMSDGGLTTTVPPDKGPDSQGVESLFRRRYS
jgi:hypothetical protein